MSVHHGHRLKFLIEKKKGNIAQIAANLNVARGTLYNYFEQEEIPKKKPSGETLIQWQTA